VISIHQRQTCKACGRPDKFDFHVPDEVWAAVVPPELANKVVCLYCFDEFAHQRQVAYASHIHTLYFAGDRGSLVFSTEHAIDVPTESQPFDR
jgi:hypothetical protein